MTPDPTLRAALAARLRAAYDRVAVATHASIGDAWLACADVAIREMEWARRGGFALAMRSEGMGEEWDDCGCDVREWGKHSHDCWRSQPLTLAPEDFTP